MGWSSGSELFSAVIEAIQPEIGSEEKRKEVYKKLIPAFRNHDWDTLDECMGEDPAYDAAAKDLHPSWFDDSDD